MNELVLTIITYYIIAILCIIIVLNLIQYYTKNKYKKEVSNYDIEKKIFHRQNKGGRSNIFSGF